MKNIFWEDMYQYYFRKKNYTDSADNISCLKSRFQILKTYLAEREFNSENVAEFLAWGTNEKTWSSTYRNNMIKTIKHVAHYSKRYIDPEELEYRRAVKKPIIILTSSDIVNLAEVTLDRGTRKDAKIIDFRYKVLIYTLYFTCARINELALLEWQYVFEDCIVLRAETTKMKKERIIDIEPQHYKLLMQLKELNLNSTYVFGFYTGKLNDDNFRDELQRRANAIGLTKPVYPHLFRHTGATHLLENGVPLHIVSEILGHADYNTTVKIYGHFSRKVLREAIRHNPILRHSLSLEDRIEDGIEAIRRVFDDLDHQSLVKAMKLMTNKLT